MKSDNTCSTCDFWTGNHLVADIKAESGECHKYPPQVGGIIPQQGVAGPTVGAVTFFPSTRGNQWCGQHEQQAVNLALQ